jgi:hypothetical protein
VTAAVSFKDMAGNLATNVTWSFQLELAPILDASVVVVSNIAPGLVLVNANGDLFTYMFTGASSELAPGLDSGEQQRPLLLPARSGCPSRGCPESSRRGAHNEQWSGR